MHRNCDTLLHRRLSIVDRILQESSIVLNRDLCLSYLHSTSLFADPRRNISMTFDTEKLEWFGYPTVKKN